MGFLSGLSGILGGGGQSSSSSNSLSGWQMLPPEIQNSFKTFANTLTPQISNAASAYTPTPQTADETAAINRLRQGFTPTAESLNADVGMLMNPYDNYVVNDINRQADSNYSILKQALNQAGQIGSNRQALGANDIEQTRLNTIGQFKQGQYNNAIAQVFNNLIPQRQADTQGMLGIGNFQRALAGQTAQAPIVGLQEVAKALGILPTSGGSTSQQSSNSSQSTNGTFGNLLSTGAGLLSLFSDRRLKENILPVGSENGHRVYEFSYKGHPSRYIGVMAQEVEKTHPHAIKYVRGYRAVNYEMIGVTFRRVA